MTIQVYPAARTTSEIATIGVVASTGSTGTPAEGFYGTLYTVTQTIPNGIYFINTLSPSIALQTKITVGNASLTMSSRASDYAFVISSTFSSYTVGLSSGWNQVNIPVITSSITGIAFGNGRFVIKGTNTGIGNIQVSTDTINWATASAIHTSAGAPTSWLNRNTVSFGNGYFFASGSAAGQFTLSTDGLNWTTRGVVLTSVGIIAKVVYNGTYYFAGTTSGFTAISTNLTTWSTAPAVSGFMQEFSLDAQNGYFVAQGSAAGLIQISTNGTTWSTRNTGALGDTGYIAYGNGTYVVTSVNGEIIISTDLTTWTLKTPVNWGTNIGSVYYADGYFMVVGFGSNSNNGPVGHFSSTDGNVWTSRSLGASRNTVDAKYVTYGNGYWVATANGSTTLSSIFRATKPSGYTDTYGSTLPHIGIFGKGYTANLSV